ncbi:MAG: glycosyltransferase family A protein [Nitrospirales bacterium]
MSSPLHPKVTVFIPVHNREHYIGDAIQSILTQHFQDFEILLIDDGSTDNSIEVMRSFHDPRITIAYNETNLGIPRTRNRGLELAKGKYIALLDSDDRASPDRLQKQVAYLDAHLDYAQIGSWCRMMNEQGHPLKKIKRQPAHPDEIKAELLFRCCMSNRTIMGRTETLRTFGYRNDFPRCQDYDLHVRLSSQFNMANIPECLVLGRIHPQQITVLTPDLGDAKKQEIVGNQLHNLGVSFSQEDLAPHLMLSRMRKMQFTPDVSYVQWAEKWLIRLLQANQSTRYYEPHVFSKILLYKWAHTCWRARKRLRIGWIRSLFLSPLTRKLLAKNY